MLWINTASMLDARQVIFNQSTPMVTYFLIFQIIGWVGITIVLLTVLLSSKVHRHPTWINFCVSWIISCISYLLLLLAGQQSNPGHNICLTQAALIYAAPPLTACTTLVLLVQLWINISPNFAGCSPRVIHWRTVLLLVAPYITHIAIFTYTLVEGLRKPDIVSKANSGIYCGITTGVPGKVSAVVIVLAMIVCITFEVLIACFFWRNWRGPAMSDNRRRVYFTTFIRTALFSTIGLLSIAFGLIFLSNVVSPLPNTLLGLLPVSAFLIFGTQADLIHVWMFRKEGPYLSSQGPQAEKSNSSIKPLSNGV